MPKANPFTDAILGEYEFDRAKSRGDFFCWTRHKTLRLAKVHAQDFIEPTTGKQQAVWSEVHLVEEKHIDKTTSHMSLFQRVEKTPLTECADKIV